MDFFDRLLIVVGFILCVMFVALVIVFIWVLWP